MSYRVTTSEDSKNNKRIIEGVLLDDVLSEGVLLELALSLHCIVLYGIVLHCVIIALHCIKL